jgi:hypothetical protein
LYDEWRDVNDPEGVNGLELEYRLVVGAIVTVEYAVGGLESWLDCAADTLPEA